MKTCNFYNQIEQLVFDELKKIYPENSIVSNAQLLSREFISDFLIVDKKTAMPVMTIETKCFKTDKLRVEKMAFDFLARQINEYNNPIKAVAAIVDDTRSIEFVDFTEAIHLNDFNFRIENYSLPSYSLLTTGTAQKVLINEKTRQKKKINQLKLICWFILPLMYICLFCLDYCGHYEISIHRLILFGMLVLSTLLPCFQEIKIGEIELKRIMSESAEKLD